MISDYINDMSFDNPYADLKPWQRNPYEKANSKNIYIGFCIKEKMNDE